MQKLKSLLNKLLLNQPSKTNYNTHVWVVVGYCGDCERKVLLTKHGECATCKGGAISVQEDTLINSMELLTYSLKLNQTRYGR